MVTEKRKQSRRKREIEEEGGQYSAQCSGVFPRSWLVHEPSGGALVTGKLHPLRDSLFEVSRRYSRVSASSPPTRHSVL